MNISIQAFAWQKASLIMTFLQGNDAETQRFKSLAARSMGDINEAGDAPFGGEVQMESKVYWWHEKYRPRKPKYYNRVHTGYEWNKYNQTHYDHDNPPPKVHLQDLQSLKYF